MGPSKYLGLGREFGLFPGETLGRFGVRSVAAMWQKGGMVH